MTNLPVEGSRILLGDKRTRAIVKKDLGSFHYIIEVNTKDLKGVKVVSLDEIRKGVFFETTNYHAMLDENNFKFKRNKQNRR